MYGEVAAVFIISSTFLTTVGLGAAELAALKLAEALELDTDDLAGTETLETLEALDEGGRGGNGVATGWGWHAITVNKINSRTSIKNGGWNKFLSAIE